MPNMFSAKSQERLETCHADLQHLFTEVLKHWDCTVTCGHRGKADQDAAVASGASKTPWPTGKHNTSPSTAIDVYPFPIPDPKTDKRASQKHYMFAGFVLGVAKQMGIGIRLGADWDGDFDLNDQTLFDLVHFELVNP